LRFETTPLELEAAFDGGRITSDGGLLWLAQIDRDLGLCEAIAEHVPEWRSNRSVRHSLVTLIRQRVYQIACGYEDQNDADTLRTDPLLKLVLGRLPETDADLASQPTLSRLENAPGAKDCLRMAEALGELYIRERSKVGAPSRILLDFDATDDPAHGEQEGAHYHGYYQEHILHPLLVFDGHTGQLVTALLRYGNTHASRGALSILKRIVRRLREAWGETLHIEIRADAGFAVPEIYDYCEKEGIGYTIGLISNPRLEEIAKDLLERAERVSEERKGEKVRLLSSGSYQAGTWEHSRRVIYKAEVLQKGTNTRFVLTSRSDAAEELYDWYIRRGRSRGVDKGLQVSPQSRPLELSSVLCQPVQTTTSRGGLLAFGCSTHEAGRGGRAANAAGYASTLAHQDRWQGQRTAHEGALTSGLRASRPTALVRALPSRP